MRRPPHGLRACSISSRHWHFWEYSACTASTLLYTGIVALMRPPADKAVVYTIAVIVCAIIVWVIIFGITALLFGM